MAGRVCASPSLLIGQGPQKQLLRTSTIKSEGPLYNVHHNHHLGEPEAPEVALNAEDILVALVLLVAAGYMLYKLTQGGVAKYRAWKADHDEFREWQRIRALPAPSEPWEEINPSTSAAVAPVAVAPRPTSPPAAAHVAFTQVNSMTEMVVDHAANSRG